jgi:hypothetical protein
LVVESIEPFSSLTSQLLSDLIDLEQDKIDVDDPIYFETIETNLELKKLEVEMLKEMFEDVKLMLEE